MTRKPHVTKVGRAFALVAGLALLAGCSGTRTLHPDGGGAVADQSVRDADQAKTFDKDFERMNKAMTDGHPVRGTMYKHASFGKHKLDEEWDVEFLGDPAAIFIRSRVQTSDSGDNLDILHPAGSAYDYFLLGKQYASIAKTPWAQVKTNYGGDPFNVCLVTGYQTVCDMQDAITYTEREHAAVVKRVIRNPDGTLTLLTGVTLQAMLKNNFLINVPSTIRAQLTPAMLHHQLTARFVLDAKGRVEIASITGTTPGTTPFAVEVGYQSTGAAKVSDLPALPAASDVTPVDYKTFNAEIARINGVGK